MLKFYLILFALVCFTLSESARLTDKEKQELLENPDMLDMAIKKSKETINNDRIQLLNLRRGCTTKYINKKKLSDKPEISDRALNIANNTLDMKPKNS